MSDGSGIKGPSIKYVTLEAGGGPRKCDRLWQREGLKSMWRHAYNFYHTYETWNLKWFLTFCCNRCILTEEGSDKTTPDKTFQTKDPPTKALGQRPPANNWERICTGGLCPGFCTRPTKNRGVRDVWRTFWGSRDVWQSVTGGGGQNWPKIALRTLWTKMSYIHRVRWM